MSPAELLRLGTEEDILKDCARAGSHSTSVAQLCEGEVSLKDFNHISPRYPWDSVELRRTPIKGEFLPKAAWALRQSLMASLSGTATTTARETHPPTRCETYQRPQKTAQSQPVLPFTSFNPFSSMCFKATPPRKELVHDLSASPPAPLPNPISTEVVALLAKSKSSQYFYISEESDEEEQEQEGHASVGNSHSHAEGSSGGTLHVVSQSEDSPISTPLPPSSVPIATDQTAGAGVHLFYQPLSPEEDSLAVSVSEDERERCAAAEETVQDVVEVASSPPPPPCKLKSSSVKGFASPLFKLTSGCVKGEKNVGMEAKHSTLQSPSAEGSESSLTVNVKSNIVGKRKLSKSKEEDEDSSSAKCNNEGVVAAAKREKDAKPSPKQRTLSASSPKRQRRSSSRTSQSITNYFPIVS